MVWTFDCLIKIKYMSLCSKLPYMDIIKLKKENWILKLTATDLVVVGKILIPLAE